MPLLSLEMVGWSLITASANSGSPGQGWWLPFRGGLAWCEQPSFSSPNLKVAGFNSLTGILLSLAFSHNLSTFVLFLFLFDIFTLVQLKLNFDFSHLSITGTRDQQRGHCALKALSLAEEPVRQQLNLPRTPLCC